jgi:hypothetical protein
MMPGEALGRRNLGSAGGFPNRWTSQGFVDACMALREFPVTRTIGPVFAFLSLAAY